VTGTEEARRLLANITPGPWIGVTNNGRKNGYGVIGRADDRGTGRAIAVFSGLDNRAADTAFCAAAPRLVASLADTLEAVAALHKPVQTMFGMECDQCRGSSLDGWPCPTARLVSPEPAEEDR
jgi:hypothetical protein